MIFRNAPRALIVALKTSLLVALLGLTACFRATDAPTWPQTVDRPVQSGDVQIESHYVKMRDGVLIAATTYLPKHDAGEKLPTILFQTRYYRAWKIRSPWKAFLPKVPDLYRPFVEAGYAVVATDVRGSGASFGHQDAPWSPAEVKDGGEILDWIVRQPWSNGSVGATGVSYVGTAAEMLATLKHPALKAIAPQFSLFDCYTDIGFPGGIHNVWFTKAWGEGNKALDNGEPISSAIVEGVLPVDDGTQLALARKDHLKNHDVHEDARGLEYRDGKTKRGYTFDQFCPSGFIKELREARIPIYSFSGWLDGGYPNSAVKRFLNVKNPGSRLILGPWDHGGRQNISPYSSSRTPAFSQSKELIRFFDRYVKGIQNGIEKEPPVRYFTLGAEKWREDREWPPRHDDVVYYLRGGGNLTTASSTRDKPTEYKADYSAGTGSDSRWNSPYNPNGAPIGYPDRAYRDEKLVLFQSQPLQKDLEVTGHPSLEIYVESTAKDGNLFAYLEEVTEDGDVHYVTEGEIRMIHRKLSGLPYETVASSPSFLREEARPLGSDANGVNIELLPVSYLFKAGSRVRLAIAAADNDHFKHNPPAAPSLRFRHDQDYPSVLILPVPTK